MKNYILAVLLIPLLVHGQKFRQGEVKLNVEAETETITPAAVSTMETVPRLLSYQGFLTVGNAGPVSDGQYTINFRLFDQEEGGTEFWSETHLSTISDGLVSALLGSNGQPIETVPMNSYLEVEIDGNVLSPRQQITSVLYSVISDSTNFAKGYTNTVDLFDTLSYFALVDTLNYFPLSAQLSAVAFSGEYDSLLNLPNLVQYAVTDTLSYYATLDSLDYYVMDTSLSEYIGTTIQPFDSVLTQITDLRYPIFEGGELLVWDGEESKWDALSDIAGGELLVFDGVQSKWVAISGAEARDTLGLEDMSIQRPDSVLITGGTILGIDDISVEDGGTGASDDSTARVNLGLRIGTDVQAWNQELQTIGSQVHSANENTKQVLVSHGYYWSAVTADSARVDLGLKIGTDVQAYDQDLQENSRFMIDNDGINGQFWSADGLERGKWKTFTEKFDFTDTTLTIKTGINAGDIVELEIGAKLPAVDGSQLLELNAHQLNDSTVSDEEFNMLAGVRTISGTDGPGGRIQTQLDNKAQMGANSDITSITGLTTMLAVNQGGTGGSNDSTARVNLGLVIGQDVQQQSVHLQDLADDGILGADKVEFGEFFIQEPGNSGWQWTSDGTDEGYWAPGGDIAYVYTDPDRGLIINGGSVAEAGSVYVTVDAGSAVNQIPRLVYSPNWVGGALPEADGSQLRFIGAHQINANVTDATDFPVSDDQFNLLSNLREDQHPTNTRLSYGLVQDQLDEKQKRSNVLDDIDTSSANVSSNDLLIWKDSEGWALLTEAEGEVTKSRVEFGDYFIDGAGINGQFWSSDGSGGGLWRTLDAHFIIDDSTLAIRTGTNAGDIVELGIGSKLPAVDGSQLLELTAVQLNDSTVSNVEFNQLANLRVASDASTDTSNTHFTFGNIQGQFDGKQNWNPYLDDLADGELTATAVEYHQFFITEPGSTGKVWTWEPSYNEYNGFGFWKLPPGAQSLGQLNDASTEGEENVFIGNLSGQDITIGTANTALGENALTNVTAGNVNIAIGAHAGTGITTGSGNILIGYQAGGDITTASDKLIIDNNNSAYPRPLIEGSFFPGERELNVDGQMLINGDLYTVNDFFIATVDENNDVVSSQFSIKDDLGDITITNKTDNKKIKFVVDNGVGSESELLVLNGANDRVEVTGTTKLSIGDEQETYIAATASGTQLNLKGAEKVVVSSDYNGSVVQLTADSVNLTGTDVFVDGNAKTTGTAEFDGAVQVDNTITVGVDGAGHDVTFFGATSGKKLLWDESGDELVMVGDTKLSFFAAAGDENITASGSGFLDIKAGTTVDITAADTVKIKAQNIVIDPGTEMIVDSDFKARGNLTVVDGNDSLIVHGDSPMAITMKNGRAGSDIIFELESGEVMRLEDVSGNANEALRVLGENLIRFGDDDISIQNESNHLTLRNKQVDGDIIFKVDDADYEILKLDGVASGAHLVDIKAATEIDGNLTLGDALILGTTLTETSRISRVSGNLTITNEEENKDIVFVGNNTGTPTEILRLVTEENTTRVSNILEVNNTDNDALGAKLELKKVRSGSPINTDELAVISVSGKNLASEVEEFAKIRMTAKNVTDGSEASSIEFWVRNAGGSSYKMMDINTTVDSTITVVGHMDVNGKLSADRWIFLNAIYPETAGDATIGTETNEWGDLYLHEDKAIKFGSTQNATITHGSGALTHEAANMVFNTNESGVIKQVMEINVETDNVVTIGTPTNDAGLKVYGTLTIAETAFEKDLIPAVDGGGLHEAGIGSPTRRWDDLYIYDEGFASFGGDNIAAVTLTHDDGTGDAKPGLILDTDSKFYFDNVNTYIGIRTDDSGILEVVSDNEVEIDGGLLLDLDGAAVTINASGASANIALTTNSGKVTLETGTAGTLSHKSDAGDEDFTIEQIDAGVARNSSLFINSAGTGEDAIAVTASAGGIDIIAEGSTGPIDITAEDVINITTSSSNSNITVTPHGSGTLALGDEDNTKVTVDALALDLKSKTGSITIEQDGGTAHKIHLLADGTGTDNLDAIHIETTLKGIKLQADNGALTSTSNSFDIKADAANSFLTQDFANGVLTVRSINTSTSGTQRLDLISDGTGGNAIDIATANGGIKITPKSDMVTENVGVLRVTTAIDNDPAALVLYADNDGTRDNDDIWRLIAENETDGVTDGAGEVKFQTWNGSTWDERMKLTRAGVLSAGSFDGGITSTLISSGEDLDPALVLETTAGGMDIEVTGQEDGEDLDISTFGITTEIRITSESTQADAIDIESDGGIDITAADAIDITTSVSSNSNITVTPDGSGTLALGTGTNTFVTVTGAKILLTGDGTAPDAINLASDGGIDITAAAAMDITTSAANANITVTPNGIGTLALGTATNTAVIGEALKVTLNGKGATADAIKLKSLGGIQAIVAEGKILELGNDDQDTYLRITPGAAGVEKIEVLNTAGDQADAITLKAKAGGIQAFVAEGKILELGNDDQDTYLRITPGAAGVEKIEVKNTAGDQADAIALTAVAGGILGRVADGKDLVLGDINGAGSDSYFKLSASATPANVKIEIKNNAGDGQVDAIKLLAVDGGITIDAGGGDAATDDVVIVGKNFSVTAAGVMAVEGAVTAASFSGTILSSSLTKDNGDLTVSTTSAGDIILDSKEEIHLDSEGNNIMMMVGGVDRLKIFDENTGDVVIQSQTDNYDMVFKNYDTEVLSLNNDNSATFSNELNAGNTLVATLGASAAVDLATASGITTIGSSNKLTVAADGALTVNNTTDATNSTSGSTIIDGGVGIAMKLYVGTNLDVTGTTLLAGETTVNTGIIPDADGAYLGSADKEFGNVFVGDASILYFGDDQEVALTHRHDEGLVLNSTRKIFFDDIGAYNQWIGSVGSDRTKIASPEVEIAAPILDIDAATLMTVETAEIRLETPTVSLNFPAAAATTTELRFYEATNNGINPTYISLEAGNVNAALTTPIELILPTAPPTNQQVLKSGQINADGKYPLIWGTDNLSQGGSVDVNYMGVGNTGAVVTLTFQAEDGDQVITWNGTTSKMSFSEALILNGDKEIFFRGTGKYIHSDAVGELNIVSDAILDVDAVGDIKIKSKDDIVLTFDSNSENTPTAKLSIADDNGEIAHFDTDGNLQLDGDIQIDGDNIKMATNTSGNILVGDNTDYNPVAVSGDVTLANTGAVAIGATKVTGAMLNDDVISGQDAMTGDVADDDELMVSDAGTVKRADFSIVRDAVYNDVSGDISIADGGVATVTGALTAEALTAGVGISAGGTFNGADARTFALDLSALSEVVIATGDLIAVLDSDGATEQLESVDDLFSIGPALVAEVAIADGDYITFLDGGATSAAKKEAIADVATLFAGTGLTAASSVIGVDASQTQITAVGTIATGTWEATDVAVAHGGTGVSTLADGGLVIGNAASAVEVVAAGATTEILVGGGASTAPVWTTATGTGAPVRAVSPTFTTPALGTPTALVGTSITGTASGFTAGNVTTNANLTGDVTSVGNATTIEGGSIDESHLNGTNGPTHGYVLTYDNGGGFTWVTQGSVAAASDRRYKKNITTVTSALEKLSKLNPVNYDWRIDEFPHKGFEDKKQWGFIAQEIEKVMPELVKEDKKGYLKLNYTGVIPLLTKAMQEQQTEIDNQQKEIDQLKAQLQSIMKMLDNDMSDKTDDKKADDNKKPVKLSMATVK